MPQNDDKIINLYYPYIKMLTFKKKISQIKTSN